MRELADGAVGPACSTRSTRTEAAAYWTHSARRSFRPRAEAISAGAGYQGTSLDPTHFSISVSPKAGVEFAQIEQAIDRVIACRIHQFA